MLRRKDHSGKGSVTEAECEGAGEGLPEKAMSGKGLEDVGELAVGIWGRHSRQRRELQRPWDGRSPGVSKNHRDELGRFQGPDGARPDNQGKDFGIYPECDGEPLEGFEQKRDVISQDHSEGYSGNNLKGARVDANRAVAIIQVRPLMA